MRNWHEFAKAFYKKKKEEDPEYFYWQAMQDASIPYKKYKIEQKQMRKEIGKTLHIIRDPLTYIMPQYLDTHGKIALKLSSNFFDNVKLVDKDFKLLYSENKQQIKKKKREEKVKKASKLLETLRASERSESYALERLHRYINIAPTNPHRIRNRIQRLRSNIRTGSGVMTSRRLVELLKSLN